VHEEISMKHWQRMTFFAAALTLAAPAAIADSCPNLLGSWNVTSESAAYDVGPPVYTAFVSSTGVLTVYDQRNCLFLARYQRTDEAEPEQWLTGAIGPSGGLTLTGSSTLARGNLVGRSRMEVVVSDFPPGGGTINTSLAVATRL
jgi:hypothetical protein